MLLPVADSWTLAHSKVCTSLVLFGTCPANKPGFFKYVWGVLYSLFLGKWTLLGCCEDSSSNKVAVLSHWSSTDAPPSAHCHGTKIGNSLPQPPACLLSPCSSGAWAESFQKCGSKQEVSAVSSSLGYHHTQPKHSSFSSADSQGWLPACDSPTIPSPPQLSALAQLALQIAWANLSHCRARVPASISPFPPSTRVHPPTRGAGSFALPRFPQGATQETCKEVFCKIQRLKVVPSDLSQAKEHELIFPGVLGSWDENIFNLKRKKIGGKQIALWKILKMQWISTECFYHSREVLPAHIFLLTPNGSINYS